MSDAPTNVRIADPSDEDEIMRLCVMLHEENGLFPMDETLVRQTLRRAFNKEGGILGVIGVPGSIEAVIYITLTNFWYSRQTYLEELFIFVHPDHRRSHNAEDLMKFAKWCSEETKFRLVIGVITNKRTKGKIRLYQRQFSDPRGHVFYYDPTEKKAQAA